MATTANNVEQNLAEVRNALSVMFSPNSPPQSAKEASDWLQNFRSNNEQRRRRIKRDNMSEACCWPVLISCWPVLISLLTLSDASESERLFAAQALLYRVRRYELADALDIEDHVALSLPPSSSAKPSDEATQRANDQGMETLAGLCVAACGGGISKPVVNHVCLALVTVALRVATWCPANQEETFVCADLVLLVTSTISKAAEVYATSHQGEPIQETVAHALLFTLAMLPECVAVNQLSIRPRALACAMNDLRSDRAGERLLQTLADLDSLATGEARIRCCLQWVTHVGLRTASLLPLLPATASALTTMVDQVGSVMLARGCSAIEVLQGGSLLTDDGYAACELVSAIFESAVEREESLSEVDTTRVTVSGRKKHRRQRANNASDVEQQILEVELAKEAAAIARTSAQLALPYFISPLHSALSLALLDGNDQSKHVLINAVSSCASSELPRLLNLVITSEGKDAAVLDLMISLLRLLLLATNVPPGKTEENKTISLSLEPWLRFHDMAIHMNLDMLQADWWVQAEECMFQSILSLMREARLDKWDAGRGVCDEEDREAFDDWRKEAREWLRGMTSSKATTEVAVVLNHALMKKCLFHITTEVDKFTSVMDDWAGCETALHSVSAFGRSITAANPDQAAELDPIVVNLLSFLSKTVVVNNNSVNGGSNSQQLACACHPAVISAATLAVGALTNWMEKRCVLAGLPGAGVALDACRVVCETSLIFSDRHPTYPIRSHDELHSGATALLKIAGAGPCCLSVAHQQSWLPRLSKCYHRIQSFRWAKLFPQQEYPLNIDVIAQGTESDISNSMMMNSESEIPLSASSRRVLLACLFVLASAQGAVCDVGNIEAAARGLSPLLHGIFHSLVAACSASGLSVEMGSDTSVESDAMSLAQMGEAAIRSGLAVVVDTLADLEVSVFLSSGQKPCAQVISAAVSSLLASPSGVHALRCCFRFASASALLCDQSNGSNGDHARLEWGGRGNHNGANIVVAEDAGVAELSGILRWLLSRALARCFSERFLDSDEVPFPMIPPTELLEFCLSMYRDDVWCDGSALFPIITTAGGGFNSDNDAASFSAHGLNNAPNSPGSPHNSGSIGSVIDYDFKKWEISNFALANVVESTLNRQTLTQDTSVPLAMNGPMLRKGSSYEAVFTLASVSINRFKHLSASMDGDKLNSILDTSAWLHLLPSLLNLLFTSADNGEKDQKDHDTGIGNLPVEASRNVAMGRSGGVTQKPRGAKQSQCLALVFPGREAECALKFLTSAIDCCPGKVVNVCGGGVMLCILLLRCACGATPSWTLDAVTLGFKHLAKASFEMADPNMRNQAMVNAAAIINTSSKGFGNNENEAAKAWGASGQLLCAWLMEAVGDPRFPRSEVSNDAKQQFLAAVAIHCGKQDWSGLKNAVKQLCGGKRKTGAGRSLGRPPDYSPWESNFDSRSIMAY